jgi:hypothetical protein
MTAQGVSQRKQLFGETDRPSQSSRSPPEATRERAMHLSEARREMQSELQKMRVTADVIESSSKTLGTVHGRYITYKEKLASAGDALRALKRRMETDDKYIYWSYMFFLSVSGYIVLKRFRILSVVYWFLVKTFALGSWTVDKFIAEEIPSSTEIQDISGISSPSMPTTTGSPVTHQSVPDPTVSPSPNEPLIEINSEL